MPSQFYINKFSDECQLGSVAYVALLYNMTINYITAESKVHHKPTWSRGV